MAKRKTATAKTTKSKALMPQKKSKAVKNPRAKRNSKKVISVHDESEEFVLEDEMVIQAQNFEEDEEFVEELDQDELLDTFADEESDDELVLEKLKNQEKPKSKKNKKSLKSRKGRKVTISQV